MVCGACRVLMDWGWMSGTADQERWWGGKNASVKCGIKDICVDPDKSVGMQLP